MLWSPATSYSHPSQKRGKEIYFKGILGFLSCPWSWYFLCYAPPNILVPSTSPLPLLAQQPTLTGEQFEDCLDLFQLCLHALILNSLALHAEWSKLWTRSEKGKRVKEKSHQALSLSPFTQWLNLYQRLKIHLHNVVILHRKYHPNGSFWFNDG